MSVQNRSTTTTIEKWCLAIDHGTHYQLGPLVDDRSQLAVTRQDRRICRVLIEEPEAEAVSRKV